MDTLHVTPSNAEQSAAWDGDEGRYWARHAQRFDDTVAGYHVTAIGGAAITPRRA